MYRTRKVDSWKLQKEEQRTAITFLPREFFNLHGYRDGKRIDLAAWLTMAENRVGRKDKMKIQLQNLREPQSETAQVLG